MHPSLLLAQIVLLHILTILAYQGNELMLHQKKKGLSINNYAYLSLSLLPAKSFSLLSREEMDINISIYSIYYF